MQVRILRLALKKSRMENISEVPAKWVVVEVKKKVGVYHKVFATWAGGYLSGDSWKLNSGISDVQQDEDYYYFVGESGSIYQCHKKHYGFATSWGGNMLNHLIKETSEEVILLEDREDWTKLKIEKE